MNAIAIAITKRMGMGSRQRHVHERVILPRPSSICRRGLPVPLGRDSRESRHLGSGRSTAPGQLEGSGTRPTNRGRRLHVRSNVYRLVIDKEIH